MAVGKKALRALMAGAVASSLCAAALAAAPARAQTSSAVEIVVGRTAITNNDISRRAAFLRLQNQRGDLRKIAREQMVEETLKRQEIARVGASVSTADVDASFARFAAGNKLTPQQLTQILNQAGVGTEHFKAFIAVQMSWPRLVNAKYGNSGRLSNQEIVKRMAESKEKPVTTEYILQQIIFVVPESKRNAITAKRKAEAEAARSKFPTCEQAKQFAKGYHDVAVRELGRMMLQQIPEEWKPLVENAKGQTTGVRVTERGAEFLAICSQRQVNDDLAAEIVFRAEDLANAGNSSDASPNEKKFLDELRSKAHIVYR
ncbi:peptidylprolyl isomerase [Rhizobiaceae bacterium BDR2-2]|uniref:Peptidylprolyl isomerase n=1 Tax=Ectorhizobium quercum TaxID=2965071 RepID=A0AAE3SY01_9HYPH|nr:peptidylprolyl isomerase [Ectorhizobium quercum]MCX8999025.1 peptidylprolyl isomerase [Ectorhizobium quercum]